MSETWRIAASPLRVRLEPNKAPVSIPLSEWLMRSHCSSYEPHWAVAVLLDPRGASLQDLVDLLSSPTPATSLDQLFESGCSWWGSTRVERALGSYDLSQMGWVPTWFPTKLPDAETDLTAEERLVWFDTIVSHFAGPERSGGQVREIGKTDIARYMVRMLHLLEAEGNASLIEAAGIPGNPLD
jgi:hypothetical protein